MLKYRLAVGLLLLCNTVVGAQTQRLVLPVAKWQAMQSALQSGQAKWLFSLPALQRVVVEVEWDKTLRQWSNYHDTVGHFVSTEAVPPNDPDYKTQWFLPEINALEAWQYSQGAGVRIALIDSGVEQDHPDLSANLDWAAGYDFADDDPDPSDMTLSGHGTTMAGLIAAVCNNGKQVCGIAPKATIVPYKINRAGNDEFFSSDMAKAILAAADSDVMIINLSVSLPKADAWVEEALAYAWQQGKIITAAAGNEGEAQISYPASSQWTLAVGATDDQKKLFEISNYGDGLSLVAPGRGLLTTSRGKAEFIVHGTSGATALTSGVLALMAAYQPRDNKTLLRDLLQATVDLADIGFDTQFGFGLLNAERAVNPTQTFEKQGVHFFQPALQSALKAGDTLQLGLIFSKMAHSSADVFLRLNQPSATLARDSIYWVYGQAMSMEKVALNQAVESPWPFSEAEFALALFGKVALLGSGQLGQVAYAGIYELMVELATINNHWHDRYLVYLH